MNCFFITSSTPVAAGWLCQTSSLDVLTFLRVTNWSPWLGCGSHPTAAQWGSDELSLSSTHGLCREVVFSLCNVASSSLDQCIERQLPWPWQHTCATQRGLGNHENQKVLRNRLNKHLLGALEVTLILSWGGCSLKTPCHTDSALSGAIHIPLFGIPWHLYKNRVKKTRVTLKTIRPKVLKSNWIYTAVLLWSQKNCPDLEPVSAPGGQSARSRNYGS